jgi:hypothetical protein
MTIPGYSCIANLSKFEVAPDAGEQQQEDRQYDYSQQLRTLPIHSSRFEG